MEGRRRIHQPASAQTSPNAMPAFDDVRSLQWLRSGAGCRRIGGRVVAVQSIALASGAVLHTFSEAD